MSVVRLHVCAAARVCQARRRRGGGRREKPATRREEEVIIGKELPRCSASLRLPRGGARRALFPRRRRRRPRPRGNVSRDTFELGPVQACRTAQALGTVRDESRARAAAPSRAQDQVLCRLRVPGGVRGQRQGGGRAPSAERGGHQHRER